VRIQKLIRNFIELFAALSILVGATGTVCAQDLTPLRKALGEYQTYDPPRTNWGPGFVFVGEIARGRISKVQQICPNLYADLEAPQSATIFLPDYNTSDSFFLAASLRFLRGLLGLSIDIDKIAGERMIEVKWRNVREYSYTGIDKWLETGEPRPIERRCRLAIEELKAKDLFKDSVFIITRAIAADSLTYEFGSSAPSRGSASAELYKAVQANAEIRSALTNGTRLEIKQRVYVGYISPTKLRDWTPTGLVAPGIVRVTGDKTDFLINGE
jgi:hypothetical protein